MHLKADVIADCYSQLRISGLTVDPAPDDLEVALMRLENMMAELKARNICLSYNDEDEPDPNSVTNVEPYARQMMATNLAIRLIPDFGKVVPPQLQMLASSSMATASAVSARDLLREVQYPRRMPRGSGSTLRSNRWQRFYRDPEQAPQDCSTNNMICGDVDDYVEHFDSWLNAGESILSYTISPDDGLTIQSSEIVGEDINYRVKAEDPTGLSSGFRIVTIVVTSSESRVATRIVNFNISTK